MEKREVERMVEFREVKESRIGKDVRKEGGEKSTRDEKERRARLGARKFL